MNAFHMFTKLEEIPATLSRDMREMKKRQIKYLDMKTIISKMKTTLVNLDNKGAKINEHEGIAILEIFPNDICRGKKDLQKPASANCGTTSSG